MLAYAEVIKMIKIVLVLLGFIIGSSICAQTHEFNDFTITISMSSDLVTSSSGYQIKVARDSFLYARLNANSKAESLVSHVVDLDNDGNFEVVILFNSTLNTPHLYSWKDYKLERLQVPEIKSSIKNLKFVDYAVSDSNFKRIVHFNTESSKKRISHYSIADLKWQIVQEPD